MELLGVTAVGNYVIGLGDTQLVNGKSKSALNSGNFDWRDVI